MSMTIDELKAYLEQCDAQYYEPDPNINNGMPLITDEEYDELMVEYYKRVLTGEQDAVPGNATGKFPTIHHVYTVKSLDKINTDVALNEAIKIRFIEGTITPKIDGLTIVVYGPGTYENNTETIYVSRGNGTDGDDLSHSCKLIPSLKGIPGVIYRVEVYLPKSQLGRLNADRITNNEEPFKNCRNAAAGIVRNLDTKYADKLKYFAYRIMNSTDKHSNQLTYLKNQGIVTAPALLYNTNGDKNKNIANIPQAIAFVSNYSQAQRDNLDYEIDGIVIQSDIEDSRNYFGETGHHPKDSVAYKFSSQGAWSILKDVHWSPGRTGVIAPVGIYDPINVLGSTISRATLHNIKHIRGLDLKIGSKIYVVKANDVIPAITKVDNTGAPLFRIEPPDKCPVCQCLLHFVGDILYCDNIDCPAKVIKNLTHIVKKECLNIDGLSKKTIEKLFDLGLINRIDDLFKLSAEAFMKCDGYAAPSAEKMVKKIHASIKAIPLDKFIYACCIPLVGKTASKNIADDKKTIDQFISDLMSASAEERFKSIEGVGLKMAQEIVSCKGHIYNFYLSIIDSGGSIQNVVVSDGTHYNFVITGALNYGTRSEYDAIIKTHGHTLQSSITKTTNYLVTNETTMTTKRKAALDKGIPIIDESEFRKILGI